jgi:hypothetical protein
MKVCFTFHCIFELNRLSTITDLDAIGARALYLLDFDGTNLPGLKDTINKQYSDVHVSLT